MSKEKSKRQQKKVFSLANERIDFFFLICNLQTNDPTREWDLSNLFGCYNNDRQKKKGGGSMFETKKTMMNYLNIPGAFRIVGLCAKGPAK